MSLLNSSSYIEAIMVEQTFSYKRKKYNEISIRGNNPRGSLISVLWSHLPTSSDDFVINVSDDHSVDDCDSEQPGQNPLQDIEPDVRAATTRKHAAI